MTDIKMTADLEVIYKWRIPSRDIQVKLQVSLDERRYYLELAQTGTRGKCDLALTGKYQFKMCKEQITTNYRGDGVSTRRVLKVFEYDPEALNDGDYKNWFTLIEPSN